MKANKILIYALSFVLGGSSLVGCTEDFEEINKNPNKTEKFSTSALFTDSNRRELLLRRDTNSGKLCRGFMQYIAEYTYTSESRYILGIGTVNNTWAMRYITLNQLKKIIELNVDDKTKEYSAREGLNRIQIAAARIMMANTYLQLVSSFGEVPYYSYGQKDNPECQALQPLKYTNPKFNTEEFIYRDLLKELKESVDELRKLETIDGKQESLNDRVFAEDGVFGTRDRLIRYAESLRLRIAVRVKDVPALRADADAVITAAKANDGANLMRDNKDSVSMEFDAGFESYWSPMYKDFVRRTDYGPSSTFVNLLKGENKRGTGVNFTKFDPRLQKIAAPRQYTKEDIIAGIDKPSDNPKNYRGMTYGVTEAVAAGQFGAGEYVSYFSSQIVNPSARQYMMEYAEVCFLMSEIKGWDETWYKKGVKASMDRWKVDPTKAEEFINSLPPANQGNVLTQKYVAMFMEPEEGWYDYNRTGYPDVLLKSGETDPLIVGVQPIKGREKEYPEVCEEFQTLYNKKPDYKFVGEFGIVFPYRYFYPPEFKDLNKENFNKAIRSMGHPDDSPKNKLLYHKK